MKEWLKNNLVCPRDKQKLQIQGNNLICPNNHLYPVVDDVPIMLVEEEEHIHGYITETLATVEEIQCSGKSLTETPTLSSDETTVDAYVQDEIVRTCGNLYAPLINNLKRYPIPELRLPSGNGARLLDVGSNWGRWTIAAALKGYQSVGIDPSLQAALAARRVSRQLNVSTDFVVGDARYLPFAKGCFDVGFSYSVFQHFSKPNTGISLDEIARTVKKDGKVFVQMPNKYGLRCFYQNARRGFSEGEGFDVRYWSPTELMNTFQEKFGETKMSVDCYFGLNVQKTDVDMLPAKYKAVVHSSEFLRGISKKMSLLVNVADSVYLESINQKQS